MTITRQDVADLWAAVECLGVEIGQVDTFPRDYPTTYAKLIHLIRDDRHQLHLAAGLSPDHLAQVLTEVQARVIDASTGRWSYHPAAPGRGVPEQRLCSWQHPVIEVPRQHTGPVRRLMAITAQRVSA